MILNKKLNLFWYTEKTFYKCVNSTFSYWCFESPRENNGKFEQFVCEEPTAVT